MPAFLLPGSFLQEVKSPSWYLSGWIPLRFFLLALLEELEALRLEELEALGMEELEALWLVCLEELEGLGQVGVAGGPGSDWSAVADGGTKRFERTREPSQSPLPTYTHTHPHSHTQTHIHTTTTFRAVFLLFVVRPKIGQLQWPRSSSTAGFAGEMHHARCSLLLRRRLW